MKILSKTYGSIEEQFVYDKNQNKKTCQRFSLIDETLRQSFCKQPVDFITSYYLCR